MKGLRQNLPSLNWKKPALKEAVKEEGSKWRDGDDDDGRRSGGRRFGKCDVLSGAKIGRGGRAQVALWYRIAELQQKEVPLTAKQGVLTSRYIGYRYTAVCTCSPYNYHELPTYFILAIITKKLGPYHLPLLII